MLEGRRPSWLIAVALAASFSACETVVVSMVEVSEIEVVPATITLLEGRSEIASVVLRESGGIELTGRPVTWTVDDPEIATVTSEGIVEGRAPGTTVVRASSEGVTGVAAVTVVREDDEDDEDDGDGDDDGEDAYDGACHISDRMLWDVRLSRNMSCVFTDVRIRGRLELREGSRLVGLRLTVDGSLTADRAEELVLTDSRIYGEIKFEKGGAVTVRGSYVEKKVELKENLGAITLSDNQVEESLKLENNRGGPFTLLRNEAERIECKDNNPFPTGGDNRTDDRTGQCAGL